MLTVEEVIHERSGHHAAVLFGIHVGPVHASAIPELVVAVRDAGINVDNEDLVAQRLLPPWPMLVDLVRLPRSILVYRCCDVRAYRLVKVEERFAYCELFVLEHVGSAVGGAACCVLDLLDWAIATVYAHCRIDKDSNEENENTERRKALCRKDRSGHLANECEKAQRREGKEESEGKEGIQRMSAKDIKLKRRRQRGACG